jgi:hypothetical protein
MVKETKAKQHSLNCKFINPGHNTTVNILWQTVIQTAIWNFLTQKMTNKLYKLIILAAVPVKQWNKTVAKFNQEGKQNN